MGAEGDGLVAVEDALVAHFGHRPQRASVSFVGVDPIEVLRFEAVPGEFAYVSLGMSRYPMTGADQLVVAADGPRAELLLQVRETDPRHREVWRRLAVLAAAPVVEGLVHQRGATVDLGEPLVVGSRCTGVVVTDGAVAPVGAVGVLQALPACSTELAWARVRGGPALLERWAAAGTDLADLDRSAVELG